MIDRYVEHHISNIINIHKIAIVNFFEFKEEFLGIGESHSFWEFVYVEKGVLTVDTKTDVFTLSEGECIFHNPGEYHHHSVNFGGASYFVIGFICNSPYMQNFCHRHFKLSPKFRSFIFSILEEAARVFNFPFNNPSNQRLKISENALLGGQQMIRTYLEQFIILLLRETYNITDSPPPVNESKDGKLVAKTKSKIALYLYSKITVEEICQEMNYSRTYLSKVFLKECGCTLGEYITKMKVDEAKGLIALKTYTFTQISDMLGFSNPLYFSRVFKKITGTSPSEYKKSIFTKA